MRLIVILFMLLLVSVAMAQEAVTDIATGPTTETVPQENWTAVETLAYAQPKDPVRQCMETCVAFNEPGPQLRYCLAQCQKLGRRRR
jgi:hypothetical protein